MRAALQVVEMMAIIAVLVATVGGLLYAVCWVCLVVVRFFPAIGSKHRHPRWDELTKQSGRGKDDG